VRFLKNVIKKLKNKNKNKKEEKIEDCQIVGNEVFF
jgi:hypothetical protein